LLLFDSVLSAKEPAKWKWRTPAGHDKWILGGRPDRLETSAAGVTNLPFLQKVTLHDFTTHGVILPEIALTP
jgi:hypothetical protein